VTLTFEQFRYGFANTVSEEEAHELYETYSVPGSGVPIFQAAFANINPRTEAKADQHNPERGPMLLVSGERDHQVPWAIARATFDRQQREPEPDRDRRGPRAGPLADHRRRLAGGRPHLPGLRLPVREVAGTAQGPSRSTAYHSAPVR
jgi:hypothetical protein